MKPATFLVLLWVSVPAAAQSTGANVAGVVTDPSGAHLADATITIALPQSGRFVTITTGREGEYRAVALLPGVRAAVVAEFPLVEVASAAFLYGHEATAGSTPRVGT